MTLKSVFSFASFGPSAEYPVVITMSPDVTSINEGGSVNFTIIVTNVPNGTTFYYSLLSVLGTVNDLDFTDGTTTGPVVINDNYAVISKTLSLDTTTEGTEAFSLQLREQSINGRILLTSTPITIADTSLSPPAILVVTSTSTVGTNINQTLLPKSIAVNTVDKATVRVFTAYSTAITPNYRIWVIKYKASGIIEWANQYGLATATDGEGGGVVIDSTGAIYFTATKNVTTYNQLYIVKLNSAGSIVWQRVLTGVIDPGSSMIRLSEATGSIFIHATTKGSPLSGYSAAVFKYNLSGVFQWQKGFYRLQGTTTSIITRSSLGIDQAGDVYIVSLSNTNSGTNGVDTTMIKVSGSTGAIVWQKKYNYIGALSGLKLVSITASGSNVYAGGIYNNNNVIVCCSVSTGQVRWTRCHNILAIQNTQPFRDCVYSNENSTEYLYSYVFLNDRGHLLKLDSNGTFIWDRTVDQGQGFGGGTPIVNLSLDTPNYYVYACTFLGANYPTNIVVPADGTLFASTSYTLRINPDLPTTGTIVYAESTLTNANLTSLTIPSAATGDYAQASPAFTDAVGSLVPTNILTYLRTSVAN